MIEVTWDDSAHDGGSEITHYDLIMNPKNDPSTKKIVSIYKATKPGDFAAQLY